MAMKLWNFVEKVNEIKNATIYVENYSYDELDSGEEIHRAEMNVEDTDTENIIATYIIEADSKKALDNQVKFTIGGYFNKIDIVNKI